MTTNPYLDDALVRVYAAGWFVGDIGTATGWLETERTARTGFRGARTQAEAWYRARQQAESQGMVGRVHEVTHGRVQ